MKKINKGLLNVIAYLLLVSLFIVIYIILGNKHLGLGEVDVLSFLGALLGGAITLVGVYYTIRASFDSIEKQRLQQIKNDEEVRYINQLPALVKIKFELDKMLASINNALQLRESLKEFLKDKRQTLEEVEYELDEMGYKIYLINETNWADIGLIQDVNFQSSLIEIRHLYTEITEPILFNINKAKIKKEKLESDTLYENIGYVNTVGLMELRELELEIDEMITNKKEAWVNIKEKDLINLLTEHIEILGVSMTAIQDFLDKRHGIRDSD